MPEVTTTIYTRPACGNCNRVKGFFDKHDVEYTELQLTEEMAEVAKTLGFREAPLVLTEVPDPLAVHAHAGYNEEILTAIVHLHTV